jgi:hypothetical protein
VWFSFTFKDIVSQYKDSSDTWVYIRALRSREVEIMFQFRSSTPYMTLSLLEIPFCFSFTLFFVGGKGGLVYKWMQCFKNRTKQNGSPVEL